MSYEGPDSLRTAQRQGEYWQPSYPRYGPPRDSGGSSVGLLVTGLAVIGLGILAWNYLGPDLRRYLKISNM